jgi:hypothetical protein
MTSHVDEQIQARIARVKAERAGRRRQRAELDANRRYGLRARYRAKLARRQSAEDAE